MPGKVWIVAGESSGDLYGAALARALRAARPGLAVAGMGGAEMKMAGVEILVDSTELGVVGIVEVLKHYPLFRRIFNDLVARAVREQPDAIVLIDYPGFNLRLAKAIRAKAPGIKLIYYVSPQVWAWGKRRIPTMAKLLDRMLVIFPFETAIWEKAGLPVRFVGHPLTHLLPESVEGQAATAALNESSVALVNGREPATVLLLPGSRISELDRLLGPMHATATALYKQRPDLRFVLPTPRERIRTYAAERLAARQAAEPGSPSIQITSGDTFKWMRRATVGLAASGTVTVQAAILGLPLVVVYRMNPLTMLLGRLLVDVKYIAMPNLVADCLVYEEYLQGDVRADVLAPALARILPGGERETVVKTGMAAAVAALEGTGDGAANGAANASETAGNASETAAAEVLAVLDGR